ncbi:hypothetical protein LCGC14_1035630 [marine sediment metagenome]|uniref:Uncharacterized protein n=1 Tax=marine sediment metagenome TaxID=412755 RepID=A0A0F9QZE3_9ZZZZ
MPFRFIEEEEAVEEAPASGKFRFVKTKKPKLAPGYIRAPVKAASEFFGGVVGAGPELAVSAAQAQPGIEQAEQAARPGFLGGAGLEPAPERGLLNLLSLIGQSELVKKLTPSSLQKRFAETTDEQFEPQTSVERIIARAARAGGSGVPFGLPGVVGAAGGLAGGIAEEAGAGPGVQTVSELAGLGLGGVAKKIAGTVPKAIKKPSGLPVRKFEKIKKPTKVFPGTARKAIKEIETDFKKLTSDLQTKTNRSYRALTEDPTFKSTVSDLFETVEKSASQIPESVSGRPIAQRLFIERTKIAQKGITKSSAEKVKDSELRKYSTALKDKNVTATQLLEQYRKNNQELSKLFPYGDRALENIGKREALESYNKAIASTIGENFKGTEFEDLFKFTNKRWSEIKKIETVDKFLDALFSDNKINFNQAEKAISDPKKAGRLKNALGKEGYAEFKQLNKDLLSQKDALKLLKARGFTGDEVPKRILTHLIVPRSAKALLGKDFVSKIWRMNLSKPQYIREWRKGLSLFKKGRVKQALGVLNKLDESTHPSHD